MNTYFVEVNNHFMVRLEIEGSFAAAEHYFLDGFKCVWGAMAYDVKGMKTDCFRGALMQDELVTLDVLEGKLKTVDERCADVKECDKKLRELDDQIAKLNGEREAVLLERDHAQEQYEKWFKRCNCENR